MAPTIAVHELKYARLKEASEYVFGFFAMD